MHHAQTEERPAAIRRLGDDGQGARRAGSKAQELLPATIGRMKPSGTSRPWQDRRTLISQPDQRLAILRMVFLCRAFAPLVNPRKKTSMFKIHSVEIDWGGRPLRLETGKIARQADGAALATYGETVVLATVVAAKTAREGVDFLPLTVDYIEKTYAAGRIPGGFFKREGRPTEKETLVSRLIDRPIRPLFPEGFINEVQVVASVLSINAEVDSDIPALLGASAALAISGLPFMGPIGAARVGYIGGKYVLNPTATQLGESKLDLVV